MVKKDPNKELFSTLNAYIDGELSPAKVEKLEKQLASDPQARQLLSELREVTEKVGDLPRAKAPRDLADGILDGIERDLLLDRDGALAELAGQKHLRRRRFIAAAAMIALAAGIAFIIHNVLSKTQFNPKENPIDSTIALNNSPSSSKPETPLREKSSIYNLSNSSSASAKTREPLIKAPSYSSLQMNVHCPDFQAGIQTIDRFLKDQKIIRVINSNVKQNHSQYSFLCSVEQFKKMFREIKKLPNHQLGLTVTSRELQYQYVIPQATEEQAMTLAREANHETQLAHAFHFNPDQLAKSTNTQLGKTDKLMDLLAQGKTSVSDLQILGNRPRQSFESTEKPLTKSHFFAANAPNSQDSKEHLFDKSKSLSADIVALTLVIQGEITTTSSMETLSPSKNPAEIQDNDLDNKSDFSSFSEFTPDHTHRD